MTKPILRLDGFSVAGKRGYAAIDPIINETVSFKLGSENFRFVLQNNVNVLCTNTMRNAFDLIFDVFIALY